MDNISVHTPTPTELNMFKVMANLEFVDLKKPAPTSNVLAPVEETPDIFPNEVIQEEDFQRPETPPARAPTPKQVTPVASPGPTPPSSPRRETESDKRPDPFLERVRELSDAEILAEKEGLLLELQMLEKQGIFKPSRQFTIDDSLEELQFQVDRANSTFSASQAVDFAKTGIRIGSSMLEMFLRKLNVNAMDGFSKNLCQDMNKFNRPLTRLYRKYWRRGSMTSPETELMMIVFGSMAMTVMQNKGPKGGLFGGMAGAVGSIGPMGSGSSAPAPPPTAPPTALPTKATVGPSVPLKPPTFPATWAPVTVPTDAFVRTVNIGSTPRKQKKETGPELTL
jgi:hypothetical protein